MQFYFAPNIKAAYGWKKWRLLSLADNETPESQEKHRKELVEHYEETRPTAWDMEVVSLKMELTYGTFREEINQQAEKILNAQKKNHKQREEEIDDPTLQTTAELRNRWPFLFLPDGMMTHFHTLTEVNFQEKLAEFLTSDAEKILVFLFLTRLKK